MFYLLLFFYCLYAICKPFFLSTFKILSCTSTSTTQNLKRRTPTEFRRPVDLQAFLLFSQQSRVGYHAGKLIESVVYCLNMSSLYNEPLFSGHLY